MDQIQMTDPAIAIAAPFIERFEGYRKDPYNDGFGTITIGIGFTHLPDGPVTMATPPMTYDDALAYLRELIVPLAADVRALSKRPLTANQCAAWCSFCYELGVPALRHSTLLADWNAGNDSAAEAQFLVWDRAGGRAVPAIENRREAELALFKTPDGARVTVSPVPPAPATEDVADALDDRFNPGA